MQLVTVTETGIPAWCSRVMRALSLTAERTLTVMATAAMARAAPAARSQKRPETAGASAPRRRAGESTGLMWAPR